MVRTGSMVRDWADMLDSSLVNRLCGARPLLLLLRPRAVMANVGYCDPVSPPT